MCPSKLFSAKRPTSFRFLNSHGNFVVENSPICPFWVRCFFFSKWDLECFFRPKKTEDSQPSWLSSPSTCWVFLARWSPIDGCLCLLLGQYRAVFRKPKCSEGVIDNSINAAQFLLFEHPFAKVLLRCFLVEVYGWSDASTDVIFC